ncbi:hypothetical protein [Legionella sainthelensi]|uniref:hypothetical protein n=1 Tax=Legionella sainthelensi TaxID=28087 RepID=UPI000E202CFA|nr:hypothetical protein [Legionella sainthelensi]
MLSKYEQLIGDESNKFKFQEQYNADNIKFKLDLRHFAVFTNRKWAKTERRQSDSNWKAHISIHHEHVGKAWDLIYPILHQYADQFKVVDMDLLENRLRDYKNNYNREELAFKDFTNSCRSKTLDELRNIAKIFVRNPADYENLTTKELSEYISAKYAEKVASLYKLVQEAERMKHGMQITIYMLPGKEEESKQLMYKIEKVLIKNEIPPGSIYKSDMPIGKYSSVRHPGKVDYQAAVDVKNHNPNNEPDPFLEPIHTYLYNLELTIEKLNSYKNTNDMSEIQKNNVQVKNNLGTKLKNNLDTYLRHHYSEEMRASKLDELKNICIQDIKEADKNIKHDKEWKPLLKNLALILSGIGLVAALVSLYFRHTTGRYGVFDNKEKLYDEVDGRNDFSTQKFYDFKKRYINTIMPKGIEHKQDNKLDEHEEQVEVLVLE